MDVPVSGARTKSDRGRDKVTHVDFTRRVVLADRIPCPFLQRRRNADEWRAGAAPAVGPQEPYPSARVHRIGGLCDNSGRRRCDECLPDKYGNDLAHVEFGGEFDIGGKAAFHEFSAGRTEKHLLPQRIAEGF
jgi:hypothetical protein